MEAVFILYNLLEKPFLELFYRIIPGVENIWKLLLSYLYKVKCTVKILLQDADYSYFSVIWQYLYGTVAQVIFANWILILIALSLTCYYRNRIFQYKGVPYMCLYKRNRYSVSEVCNMIKECDTDISRRVILALEANKQLDINSVQPSSSSGLTPFLCACMSGNIELVEYMLKHGADVNSQTTWQDGALHIAAFSCANQNCMNSFDVISFLIQAGCDINAQNWLGNTPLCIAASYDKERLIRYLLFQGADPSMCNNDGIYPIDFATNAGYKHIASLLAIQVSNPHVWDFIEPHTPPRIRLGLQTPSKQHLVESSFSLNKRNSKLNMFKTPRPVRACRHTVDSGLSTKRSRCR